MKEERIIEEMARLEELESICGTVCMIDQCRTTGEPMPIPVPFSCDYLTDHNACNRVIDGMDDVSRNEAFNWLWRITNTSDIFLIPSHCGTTLQATCPQKCEAVLKAYGKWEA